ncbi:hypothetical protein [Lentzea albidocapillata]|uniref:Uncharacterized protein n=1 Tax=Lentzea albidocapillata TaxID=40571 RepID=A0A1W2FJQ6_9PSEU|nr:hypothetical protein [Lentzea albidocapillata]SMD22023.1 hypothetical protein SAMN05660733_06555 [Lentzea albidocapillata]
MSNRTRVLTALALALAATFAAVPAANATHQGSPTTQQLVEHCVWANSCKFKPSGGMQIFNGPRQFAGSSTNCTDFNQTRVIRYEATTGTKNTFGVEISGGVKLGQIYEASIKASFQREWSWSETQADEIRQEVGPRSRVDIYVSKQQARVAGTWEMQFEDRWYGHYYWYVDGQVEGQTRGQPWDMQAEQRGANC